MQLIKEWMKTTNGKHYLDHFLELIVDNISEESHSSGFRAWAIEKLLSHISKWPNKEYQRK